MPMNDHSLDVVWTFVVPPANDQRLVITQRQDGPFRKDHVGMLGHFYVSREKLIAGQWMHVAGSSSGAYTRYTQAHGVAEAQWERLASSAGNSGAASGSQDQPKGDA